MSRSHSSFHDTDAAHPSHNSYSATRIYLHWISALVILWATVTGFFVVWLPSTSNTRHFIDNVNPQLTTLLIPFFVWRIALAMNGHSKRNGAARGLQERIAIYVHISLYVNITAVLVSGVLMMTHSVNILGLIILPQLIHSVNLLSNLFNIHKVFCVLLGGLITLHILAVVKHSLVGHSVFHRMVPVIHRAKI